MARNDKAEVLNKNERWGLERWNAGTLGSGLVERWGHVERWGLERWGQVLH